MGALLACRRQDRYHRAAERFAAYGHASRNFPYAPGAGRSGEDAHAYFVSRWAEDMHAVPRFLWNAKMRFGKTFTTYQLVKKLGAKRVLVVTFKPAVEDAWQTDLENHADFDGWQYLSRNSDSDPSQISARKPLVYFGSFQDLLGRDLFGNIKPKNEWLHKVKWDLVVFDEYHFGAWRDTAKELFEGEEDAVAKKEAKLEYATGLEKVNEDLTVLSEKEVEFLPITTKAYLYLSGTRSKLWPRASSSKNKSSTGHIPTNSALKKSLPRRDPVIGIPYSALPQMRLLTYQMPEELVAIASAGNLTSSISTSSFLRPAQVARRNSSTRMTYKSGWTLFGASTHQRPSRALRQARGRHSHIRTCACCPISSTHFGFCRTSQPVTRWRTY